MTDAETDAENDAAKESGPDLEGGSVVRRRLLLVRHAQAKASAATDHERDLCADGRAGAAWLGEWLRDTGYAPDLVVTSDARRARRTWEEAAIAGGLDDADVIVEPALYSAGAESSLELIRTTDPAVHTLVLLGHNPTIASLAHLLRDGHGSERAAIRMARAHPPGAVALLVSRVAWSELDWHGARLVDFQVPPG